MVVVLPAFLHRNTTAFAALQHALKWKNLSMFANWVIIGSIGFLIQAHTEHVAQRIHKGSQGQDRAFWEFFHMHFADSEAQPASLQDCSHAAAFGQHLF